MRAQPDAAAARGDRNISCSQFPGEDLWVSSKNDLARALLKGRHAGSPRQSDPRSVRCLNNESRCETSAWNLSRVPCVRVRAPRKPTKGELDIASDIANMEPERRRGDLKFQPKALSLTSNAREHGVASGIEKTTPRPSGSACQPEDAMRFGGLHIWDLFVTNPEFSKLQLLCLGDGERDTSYGIWLPNICPVHLIFVVRCWRRPGPNLKFSENRADQSLEFFDVGTLAVQRP